MGHIREEHRSFARLVAIAVAVGVAAPLVGLYLSYWLNSATGATIVLVETAVFAVALGVTSVRRRGPSVSNEIGPA